MFMQLLTIIELLITQPMTRSLFIRKMWEIHFYGQNYSTIKKANNNNNKRKYKTDIKSEGAISKISKETNKSFMTIK